MKYTIGIDYGTLSARALLVELESGRECASAVFEYPNGVISGEYRGVKLGRDFALQESRDWLDALDFLLPELMKNIEPDELIGIGVDFTSATILPIKSDGTPLSSLPEFEREPHAAAKLWKHHGAKEEAELLAKALEIFDPERLQRCGGRVSSEWMLPKIMETLNNAPEVYFAADRFVEAGDFITQALTGRESHNLCAADYKALHTEDGYPSDELLRALDARLVALYGTRISLETTPAGAPAGYVSEEASARYGIPAGIPVASAYIDAHAGLPGAGVTEPGKLMMIIGTSTGHLLLSERLELVPGICGISKDGVIPGLYCYEAGQSAVGDIFDWFVKNCVPQGYSDEAKSRGIGLHKLLREKARGEKPGESGLLALDWWNGNRSPLQDATLSGLIVGLTLETKPEEIYRALLEATAFGTKKIIDGFERAGFEISELIAAGGIAAKDDLMMQIYADVTGRPIKLAASEQAPALGSAIAAAVTAGEFASFTEASAHIGGVREGGFEPNPDAAARYGELYALWCELVDIFGTSGFMKRLRALGK